MRNFAMVSALHVVHVAMLAAIPTLFSDALPVGADDAVYPSGIVIRLDERGRLCVHKLRDLSESEFYAGPGLLVWSDGLHERCERLPWSVSTSAAWTSALTQQLLTDPADSRGLGVTAGTTSSVMSLQLDQLLGRANVRGIGFVTPQGRQLSRQISIRRSAIDGGYPSAKVSIYRGNEQLLSIRMQEGQSNLAWEEIHDLPTELKDGLPPGAYTIRDEDGGTSSRFIVEDEAQRLRVLQSPRELADLLGTTESPLYVQFTVDHFLADNGRTDAEPYLIDALAVLERVDDDQLTNHLRHQKTLLIQRLSGDDSRVLRQNSLPDATGIEPVDQARRQIQRGNWKSALEILGNFSPVSPRDAAFVDLYRAVALSESGPTTESIARPLFSSAIAVLQDSPSDAYRAHSNFASFLLDRMQDRLHNQAFLASSGVANPVLHALSDWELARNHYECALKLSEQLPASDRSAVQVNLARTFAFLADLIQSLDDVDDPQFEELKDSASNQSRLLAESVFHEASEPGDKAPVSDDSTLAVAHEVLAQLAFRRGDSVKCYEHADAAQRHYLNVGALAGVESLERLRGLAALRGMVPPNASNLDFDPKGESLRHFLISHLISEALRENVPPDASGLTRAGFFARRAYVYEQIIELLLERGEAHRALHYAELSKARTLQDVLLAQSPQPDARDQTTDISEMLGEWPGKFAAVEYYVASRNTWCFLVGTTGELQTHLLTDQSGRPILSSDLLRRVRELLWSFEHQSIKMTNRLLSGQGFEHSWQTELESLRRVLLPDSVMAELRQADQVVIIPHHLLHYFPFAALVTEQDSVTTDARQMVKPRFLVDEPFSLTHSPSLASWYRLVQRPRDPISSVYVVGLGEFESAPSLPGVNLEIENLQGSFGTRVRQVISGKQATEQRTKRLLSRRGMIFVGTHGSNIADQSLDSFLVLQPDAENDGFLTAREIYQGDGGVDLVVMSACYSGLADRSPLPGDDLFGLQRAFLHSGTKCVVAGLWDVYDQTAPMIMQRFTDHLASGVPVSDSLARSQREFLEMLRGSSAVEPWLHPYYWAVYAIAGDGRVSFSQPPNAAALDVRRSNRPSYHAAQP